MPDLLRVDRDHGIVDIRSYGSVSEGDLAASIAKVKEIAADEGINRVLVDTKDQESLPSTGAIFDLISRFPREVAVALVSADQPTAEEIHFIETVAVNRGISIRVFRERDEAEEWLHSLQVPGPTT